ncbi:uncharacterized protein LOC111156241 isoform X2 [Enhydra lutris kenyoni]|uniref:Uncharacterized protein LOC111156241 isoform X2 n=1 Tax=Enhydra lutris kenyoni TaxID=391180 RepID=A0A2Y9KFX7_ENHLU|nr:uncharacterized protein LOC111156241 isoform X2 [Enhydra lutris kenyoni]
MVLPARPEQVSTQALSPALVWWQPPCQLFALHEALPESSEERTGRITGPCSLLMDTRPWKQRAGPSLRTPTSCRSQGTSENACNFEVRINVIVKVTGTADELGVVTRTCEGNTKFPVENTQNKQAGAAGGLCPRGRSGAAGPDSRHQQPALAVRVLGGAVQNLPSCGHRPPVWKPCCWRSLGLEASSRVGSRARDGAHKERACPGSARAPRLLSQSHLQEPVFSCLRPTGRSAWNALGPVSTGPGVPPPAGPDAASFQKGWGGHREVGSPPEGGRIPGGRVPAARPSSSASTRVPDSVPCLCPRGCSCHHLLLPPPPTGAPFSRTPGLFS